jgi:hypothetical protein
MSYVSRFLRRTGRESDRRIARDSAGGSRPALPMNVPGGEAEASPSAPRTNGRP